MRNQKIQKQRLLRLEDAFPVVGIFTQLSKSIKYDTQNSVLRELKRSGSTALMIYYQTFICGYIMNYFNVFDKLMRL